MEDEQFEDRVRSGFRSALADVEPSPQLDSRVAAIVGGATVAESAGRRRRRALVPLVAAMTGVALAVTAVVVVTRPDARDDRVVAAGPGRDDAAGRGWEAFDAGPLATRAEPRAVWTGTEMIVVGGLAVEQYAAFADGAAYDPETGRWRRIASRPDPGRIMVAAWTGSELFALGRHDGIALEDMRSAHLYDPRADRWRAASAPPRGFDAPEGAWWTGTEVLVWQLGRGMLYDPAGDRWRDVPPIDVPGATAPGRAVWLEGAGVLAVQAATTPDGGGPLAPALFLFEPASGRWRPAARAPSDIPQFGLAYAAWVGTGLVFSEPHAGPTYAYEPSSDTWRGLPPPEVARDRGTGYFTGVPLGGHGGAVRVGDSRHPVIALTPDGRWSYPPAPGGAVPGPDGVALWTGRQLVLWGRPGDAGPADGNAAWAWTPGDAASSPVADAATTTTPGDGEGTLPTPTGVAGTPTTLAAPAPGATVPGTVVAVDRRSADLTEMFDSKVSGRATAEQTGPSTWRIEVTVTGTLPANRHVVSVQERLPDGSLSQISGLCGFTSDADGSGRCEGDVDLGPGGPAAVGVGGYDPSSNGYRTVAYGDFGTP